jgi:flagellar hook-basal body complex protein FliE
MNTGMEYSAIGNMPHQILTPNDKFAGSARPDSGARVGMPSDNFGATLISHGLKSDGSMPVKGALEGFVDGINAKQKAADESRRAFLAGESNNLHQTMIAAQEASVAFSLMVEVRNKVMEAYQELMRMQI